VALIVDMHSCLCDMPAANYLQASLLQKKLNNCLIVIEYLTNVLDIDSCGKNSDSFSAGKGDIRH